MKRTLIKYGGSLLEEPGHRSAFLKDVAELSKRMGLILVHGGGKEISRRMEEAGLKPHFVQGRRFTDEAAMRVVEEALSRLNAEIVKDLRSYGADARGGSGRTGPLVIGTAIAELGRVGLPSAVDAQALEAFLKTTPLPVLYSVGQDKDGQPLNINADEFAQALAVSLRAENLIFLTDTGGLLDATQTVIASVTPAGADRLIRDGVATGGMKVKVESCVQALRDGVGRVEIVKNIRHLLHGQPPEGTVFIHGH